MTGPDECTCRALPPGHDDDQCATATRRRCWCGRPVPASSLDGVQCAEHDEEVAS